MPRKITKLVTVDLDLIKTMLVRVQFRFWKARKVIMYDKFKSFVKIVEITYGIIPSSRGS
jgi:hypothetical protein